MRHAKEIRIALAATLALLVGADPSLAYRRIVEVDRRLAEPVWGLVVGLGQRRPSGAGDTALELTTALRHVRPSYEDNRLHSIAYELGAHTFSSSQADLVTYDFGVYLYHPREDTFSFDYHWFYGAGAGITQVEQPLVDKDSVPGVYLAGGLQGRVRDFFLEAKLKVVGARESDFPVSGLVVSLVGTYYFQP